MSFDRARRIADAVLYEGYVLYPYRASARKNRVRWQFGVVAPREWSELGGCESWWTQGACPIAARPGARVECLVRFLRVRRRALERALGDRDDGFEPIESLEVDGKLWASWDEGVESEMAFDCELVPGQRRFEIRIAGAGSTEMIHDRGGRLVARVVYEELALQGWVTIAIEPVGSYLGVRVRVENHSFCLQPTAPREDVLASSFLGSHILMHATGGEFVSLTDPGEEPARAAAAACVNAGLWPVLAGEPGDRALVLCSPIILEDHPRLAPESPGEFFDATEIDELLTLRTMTLTDEEKREARATDRRAAEILDRVDSMPAEIFERLHGAIRELRCAESTPLTGDGCPLPDAQPETGNRRPEPGPCAGNQRKPPREPPRKAGAVSCWDPIADQLVSPQTDAVEVRGVRVAKGSRVRLRPGPGADAQDMFVAGRIGRVEGVFIDIEDKRYLAVCLEDDPAGDLNRWHGRFLYFSPEEIEPLAEGI